MTGTRPATSILGPSSEASQPGIPSYAYSIPGSRRDTESSINTEGSSPLHQDFLALRYHGNCRRCNHRYGGEIIKVPIDQKSYRGVRCSKCMSKMMGFGGTADHMSLLSVESMDPSSSHVQDEKGVHEAVLRAAAAMGAVGSPVLRALPESDRSRAASRGPSIRHSGAPNTATQPHTDFTDKTEPLRASNPHAQSTVLGTDLTQGHNHVPNEAARSSKPPSVRNPRQAIHWIKNLLHTRLIKKMRLKKVWHNPLRKNPKGKGNAEPGSTPEEVVLPQIPLCDPEDSTHCQHSPSASQARLSPPSIGVRKDDDESLRESPADVLGTVNWIRNQLTRRRYGPCGVDCRCNMHHKTPSSDHARPPSIPENLDLYLQEGHYAMPVNHRMQGQSHHQDFAHFGGHFDDETSLTTRSLSISTTFSHARTAVSGVSGDSVPAISSPHLSHLGLAVAGPRSQSPRSSLRLFPTSHPRDSVNGRATPEMLGGGAEDRGRRSGAAVTQRASALEFFNGGSTPYLQRRSSFQEQAYTGAPGPTRPSTPHVNGYRTPDEGNQDSMVLQPEAATDV